MRNHTVALGASVMLALTLLGVGCGKARPPAPPSAPAVPSVPSPDPLTDDLDQAIEDLKVVE